MATAQQDFRVTVAPAPVWNPPFPRLAAYPISVWAPSPDQYTSLAKMDFVILAFHPWHDVGAVAATLRARAQQLGRGDKIKIFSYTDNTSWWAGTDDLVQKISAEKGANGNGDWWLRNAAGQLHTAWPTTERWFNTMGEAIAAVPLPSLTINISRNVTRDAQGRTASEWLADRHDERLATATALDGIFMDVVAGNHLAGVAPSNADWDEDGVNESRDTQTVKDWRAQGKYDYFARMKALHPNWLFLANDSGEINASTPHPLLWGNPPGTGIFVGGVWEAWTGVSWATEEWGTWDEAMANYRKSLSLCSPPKLTGVVNFLETVSTASDRYQRMRYSLASCLMDDGYYSIANTMSYNSVLWFDEYDWNLGYPTQTPRSSPHQDGVYLREFDNGCALVNPKGNGPRTIALPSAGANMRWDRLSGTQEPAINNGQTNVTSVSIAERDGLILKRVSVS